MHNISAGNGYLSTYITREYYADENRRYFENPALFLRVMFFWTTISLILSYELLNKTTIFYPSLFSTTVIDPKLPPISEGPHYPPIYPP